MSTHDLKIISVPFHIDDVSTAGQVFVPINRECEGTIVEIRTVLNAAIGTANAVLTSKIGGTAVTGGAITITQSGSATGDLDSCSPTAANFVVEGDVIEVETNGASTNTVKVFGMIMINRGGH